MNSSWIYVFLGGRKFMVAMTCIILSFIALIERFLTGGQWVTVVSIISALYKASNLAGEKLPTNATATPEKIPPLEDK